MYRGDNNPADQYPISAGFKKVAGHESPAPVPYRASGFVLWPFANAATFPILEADPKSPGEGQTGAFDPNRAATTTCSAREGDPSIASSGHLDLAHPLSGQFGPKEDQWEIRNSPRQPKSGAGQVRPGEAMLV